MQVSKGRRRIIHGLDVRDWGLTVREEDLAPDAAARAEEVRAWLVQLRGGAPFLSSLDGKLLLDWLDVGVPLPTILRGIEQVAERRRAKRTRTPFTLQSCKATVERLVRHGGGWRIPADLGAALAPATDDEAVSRALLELNALSEVVAEERARHACSILRRFHEEAWSAIGDERAALLAEAAAELEELRGALGAEAFARACEEHARDRVRARYPTLSARRVWEEFGLGVA